MKMKYFPIHGYSYHKYHFVTIFRLPIIQGGTFSFFVPTFAILSLPKFQCPDGFDKNTNTWIDSSVSIENKTEEWQFRMREIQGAICVSAIFQVVMGFTGKLFIGLPYIYHCCLKIKF